jgi:ligand-binding SRPBCC domain-containing protein
MRQRFETSQWVPFPVELVFAFFANPSNLPHVMPPGLKVRLEDARIQPPAARPMAADPARRFRSVAAGVGSEILISFSLLPVLPRASSLHVINEFEWNSHFCDEQIRGPFGAFHHRHGIVTEFRDWIEGTLVSDEINYELGAGMLNPIAVPVARGRLERMFAYREKRLPEILEAASRQAVKRG